MVLKKKKGKKDVTGEQIKEERDEKQPPASQKEVTEKMRKKSLEKSPTKKDAEAGWVMVPTPGLVMTHYLKETMFRGKTENCVFGRFFEFSYDYQISQGTR